MTRANELDHRLDDILVDAHDEDEQLGGFAVEFENEVPLPTAATVGGLKVTVVELEDRGSRQGLVARCRLDGGAELPVPIIDVHFAAESEGWWITAAYRKWLGVEPFPIPPKGSAVPDLDLSRPIELVVLGTRRSVSRCRHVASGVDFSFRSGDTHKLVPGEVVTIHGNKQWIHAKHPYLSGRVAGQRIDLGAMGLEPLAVRDGFDWDPEEHYWGEDEEPPAWAHAIIARGVRQSFELEHPIPNFDPRSFDDGPILKAIALHRQREFEEAERVLMDLLIADLRCLDAHAHLGSFAFDYRVDRALRHYEVGVAIGDAALGDSFPGLLPWGRLDNRPFLRCLHGYGLCLWRTSAVDKARQIFQRMLWLNPSDNQGARFLLHDVDEGRPWTPDDDQ